MLIPDTSRWQAVCFILSALLIIHYGAVGWIALNPTVSEGYEQYYMGPLSSYPGEEIEEYEPSEKIYFDSGKSDRGVFDAENYMIGWYIQESWGTWSQGKQSTLLLNINNQTDSEYILRINGQPMSEKHTFPVGVLVNNEKVGDITEFENGTAELTIKSHIVSEEKFNNITFVVNDPTSPAELGDSTDTRQLGLGVTWIELVPIENRSLKRN